MLIDAPAIEIGENVWIGRTYADAPEIDGVVYVSGENLSTGQMVPVEITGREGYDLLGEITEEDEEAENETCSH